MSSFSRLRNDGLVGVYLSFYLRTKHYFFFYVRKTKTNFLCLYFIESNKNKNKTFSQNDKHRLAMCSPDNIHQPAYCDTCTVDWTTSQDMTYERLGFPGFYQTLVKKYRFKNLTMVNSRRFNHFFLFY